jgi:autotransporter translocation and assembly factor TamB
MNVIRRTLQVVTLIGTLLIGIVAFSLIVSQTPWFKDWLRRYLVKEAAQYLNGELSIGRLSGNLFFGVELTDIAIDVDGERVVSIKDAGVDYSVFRLLSGGVVLDDLRLNKPVFRLRRTTDGWNLAQLVKEQEKEADREGPRKPISIREVGISAGSLSIDGAVGTSGYTLPRRIEDLNARISFQYEPVHYSVGIGHVSFRGAAPEFGLERLSGKIAVRDDNVYLDRLLLHTKESAIEIDGRIDDYLSAPEANLTVQADKISFPELARVIPALRGYTLQPQVKVVARGPMHELHLDVDVKSTAGSVRGPLTANLRDASRRVEGDLTIQHLDLGPLLKDAAHRSDITGQARFDLSFPRTDPVNGMSGSFRVAAPRVAYAKYDARDVKARGRVVGRRIVLDAAEANAYGGSGTASGSIVRPSERGGNLSQGRGPTPAWAYDLHGRARNVDMRRLPRHIGAPQLATDLDLQYQVRGRGRRVEGHAIVAPSVVEGARVAGGTKATFLVDGRSLEYGAEGSIANLNLQRLGRGLRVATLAEDRFDSDISGQFNVRGGGRDLDSLEFHASGTLQDSRLFGGQLPVMTFDSQLANRRLDGTAKGSFAGFDPARMAGKPKLAGRLNGDVDARFVLANIGSPVTPDTIEAKGRIILTDSDIGGLELNRVAVDGEYASRVGQIRELTATGPDLNVQASGSLALDQRSASNLKYRAQSTNLERIGALVNKPLRGAVTLDGQIAGNAADLRTTGLLEGSNVAYGNNSALQVTSKYAVSVPDLTIDRAAVDSDTRAVFVKLGNQEINEITAVTKYANQQVLFQTALKQGARELQATGNVVLHTDHQELHLKQFAVRTEGVEWRSARGDLAVKYGQNILKFENVELVSGDQRLVVDGAVAMKEGAAGTLDVRASNVDLAAIDRLALGTRRIEGRLNANVRLTGSMAAPRVEGDIGVQNGAFQLFKYESLTAKVDYQKAGLTLDARLQQSPAAWLTAQGYLPASFLRPGVSREHVEATGTDVADLRIRTSTIDLGLVQGFTPYVRNVTGTMQADVRVTGSGRDPHLHGGLDIRQGAFLVVPSHVSYTGFDTNIAFESDRIVIKAMRIVDEHGSPLTMSGQLATHERTLGAFDVKVNAKAFEIMDNELANVDIDTDLRIVGELRRPRVEGDLAVQQGRIEVDRVLDLMADRTAYALESRPATTQETAAKAAPAAGGIEVVKPESQQPVLGEAGKLEAGQTSKQKEAPATGGSPATPGGEGGVFDALALNVRVRVPNNLILRGKDIRAGNSPIGVGAMNVTLGGNVRAQKAAGDSVRLVGTVNTVRGTYEFQGRRFEILRDGRIRFVGLPDINPQLDVRARRIISGVEARIHVAGSMRQPELTLTSVPPLDEADILSLIVFNQPVNQLGEGERVSLAERAGSLASGFVVSPVVGSLTRALDIDLLEVQTATDGGQIGPRITLGEQVGEKLFVKVTQQFGGHDFSEFMAEYQLADFLRLQSRLSPDAAPRANRFLTQRVERVGFDLIFFFSY